MKIRRGFVTNSSSASYTIVCKTDLSKEEIVQKICDNDRLSQLINPRYELKIDNDTSAIFVIDGYKVITISLKESEWYLDEGTMILNDIDEFILYGLVQRIVNGKVMGINISKTLLSEDYNIRTTFYENNQSTLTKNEDPKEEED